MFKKLIFAGFAAATMLTATPAFADNPDKIGKGDYLVFVFPGTHIDQAQGVVLQSFDAACRDQAMRQSPSALKEVFLTAMRNAPGAFVGGFVGSKVGGLISPYGGPSAVGYGKYNSIATAAGGIGAGITTYEMGKHTAIAGCMVNFMNQVHQAKLMRNITIAYSTFATRGHPLRISTMPVATESSKEEARLVGLMYRDDDDAPSSNSSRSTGNSRRSEDSDADGVEPAAPPPAH